MLSKLIRQHKEDNPQLTAKQIANTLGTTATYVHQVLHNAQKKKKNLVATKKATPTDGQQILRQEIARLNQEVEDLKYEMNQMGNLLDEYRDKVREMKLHHGGLEYIISYLESRLGIERKDDGATV